MLVALSSLVSLQQGVCRNQVPATSSLRCVSQSAAVQGMTKFVPKSFPGPLIRKEVLNLAQSIDVPERPFAVVLGKLYSNGQGH